MGVRGLWTLLQDKGHQAPPLYPQHIPATLQGRARIDVNAAFYGTIRWAYGTLDTDKAHAALEKRVSEIGTKEQLVLYVDGRPCQEKLSTIQHRESIRQEAVPLAQKALACQRSSFVSYMQQNGWQIAFCATEADVAIAVDCQPQDVVVTTDSDLLVYTSVRTVFRPIRRSRFLVYDKVSVVAAIGLTDRQLLILGIVSKNDYTSNIPRFGVKSNYSLVKGISSDNDINRMIQRCLNGIDANVPKSPQQFAASTQVFSSLVQTSIDDVQSSEVSSIDYRSLQTQLSIFSKQYALQRKASLDALKANKGSPSSSRSLKIRYTNFQVQLQRPRYSYHVRYEPTTRYARPDVLVQYKRKRWKQPPDRPQESGSPPKAKTPIKAPLHNVDKKQILNALNFEHPTVALDIGTLTANVKKAPAKQVLVADIIRGAVRGASKVKRRCQELIGRYLEMIGLSPNSMDEKIFVCLCPPQSKPTSDTQDGEGEDGSTRHQDDDGLVTKSKGHQQLQQFLQSFMAFLYSGNEPMKGATNNFIERLRNLQLLPTPSKESRSNSRRPTAYTPTSLVRSVASQLAAELLRHWKGGCNALCDKLMNQMQQGTLPCVYDLDPRPSDSSLNMEFTKLTGRSQAEFAQYEIIDGWLPYVEPGLIIRHFVADLAVDGLSKRQLGKAGVKTAIKFPSLLEIRNHINSLRGPSFDPRTYSQKGYILRGSIKTDGHRLSLLGFKLRELQSVRYRRYELDILPDFRTTTIGGTDSYLTEVRNVVKTEQDMIDLWGLRRNQADQITYLGIDLVASPQEPREGARFLNLAVKQKAAYQPTLQHRRWLEMQKRNKFTESTTQAGSSSTSSSNIHQAQPSSISEVESTLPPLHGENAAFAAHMNHRSSYLQPLDAFYNGNGHIFKKHKWDAKRAWMAEFKRIADSLLRMVGGSIGARRDTSNKVIIGVGLAKFSITNRLSSLDGTFQSYFVQLARSLGYIVVGVNEYYSSKKCPRCTGFVARTESGRSCL
ncbi:hypothetical protein BGW41_004258, partial [Actinomortierella wolfii]